MTNQGLDADLDEVECIIAGMIWKVSEPAHPCTDLADIDNCERLVGLHERLHLAWTAYCRSVKEWTVSSAQSEGTAEEYVIMIITLALHYSAYTYTISLSKLLRAQKGCTRWAA